MSGSARPAAPAGNDPAVEAAFDATPDDVVAEILDGELFTSPRPRPRHARVAMRLSQSLVAFDDRPSPPERPGGWVLLVEPELHLGRRPDRVVPDLAGWQDERFPGVDAEDAEEPAAISAPPDWVCEILSERTEGIDRGKKRRIYRREHVGHLWYVDPRDRTLEIWRLEGERWHELETFEGDVAVRAPPFDAIEIDLARLWRWRRR
jgi:Uma2 family endonuclease